LEKQALDQAQLSQMRTAVMTVLRDLTSKKLSMMPCTMYGDGMTFSPVCLQLLGLL